LGMIEKKKIYIRKALQTSKIFLKAISAIPACF
jgi:hypothetical protein